MTSRRCSKGAPLALLPALLLADAGAAAAQPRGQPPVFAPAHERVAGPAVAVEGDRLTIAGRPVRLLGIDAPDPGQVCLNRYGSGFDCFAIATAVLAALIEGAEVECTVADRDRTGMDLGECRARGIDLGVAMVARGWAFAYRALTPAYQQGEAYAMSRRLGLWSGRVEKPWQWRTRRLRQSTR